MESPKRHRVYKNLFMDSGRWDAYEPRDGDIIVCTPYKAGTTWTQTICALLIFQNKIFPKPLSELSPWLDMRLASIDDVMANFESQTHRRIIKTHTPLDGLPYHDNVTYLYCGRDPRDVFVSMQNHGKNQRQDQIFKRLKEQGVEASPPRPLPDDVNERFRLWISKPAFDWEEDGFPYWSVFSHLKTFWQFRELPNIEFLHFADLRADLDGQMRRVAKILDIPVDESIWPDLVQAATFSEMKNNADNVAPDVNHDVWASNSAFFHKGENRQWEQVLSAENLSLYEQIKHQRAESAVIEWLENGVIATRSEYP